MQRCPPECTNFYFCMNSQCYIIYAITEKNVAQRIKDNYYARCILLSLFKMFCWDVKLIAIKDMCLYAYMCKFSKFTIGGRRKSFQKFIHMSHLTTMYAAKKPTSAILLSYQHLRLDILQRLLLKNLQSNIKSTTLHSNQI